LGSIASDGCDVAAILSNPSLLKERFITWGDWKDEAIC
jgi:hypothetical protein